MLATQSKNNNIIAKLYQQRRLKHINRVFCFYRDQFSNRQIVNTDLAVKNNKTQFNQLLNQIKEKINLANFSQQKYLAQGNEFLFETPEQINESIIQLYQKCQEMLKLCFSKIEDNHLKELEQNILMQILQSLSIRIKKQERDLDKFYFLALFDAIINFHLKCQNSNRELEQSILIYFEKFNGWQTTFSILQEDYTSISFSILSFLESIMIILLNQKGQMHSQNEFFHKIISQILLQTDWMTQDENIKDQLQEVIWFILYGLPVKELWKILNFGLISKLLQAQMMEHAHLCIFRTQQWLQNKEIQLHASYFEIYSQIKNQLQIFEGEEQIQDNFIAQS